MVNRWYQCLLVFIIIALTACSSIAPPREFAPDGDLIKGAIALQLRQTEQHLSQQLNATAPVIEISQIVVSNLDPIFINQLPSYHLQGTYNLQLKLPRQQVTQKHNRFDIYLQRQSEGKTWRLLRREANSSTVESQWKSYLLRN